jgi:hypothetical protein
MEEQYEKKYTEIYSLRCPTTGGTAMELEITTIFVLCDEIFSALNIQEDKQVHMTNAEVMTVALTAAQYFHGHMEHTRRFLAEHGYMSRMLSESRLNRRLHAIPEAAWSLLAHILAETFKADNVSQEYCLDSFPVPVCDNIRIKRAKLYSDEAYRGYIASKRRYFFGLRVHMVVTASGQPVEFILRPGSESDVAVLKDFNFDLPPNAECYADRIYNDYTFEDLLLEAAQIRLKPARKKNSTRATDPYVVVHYEQYTRKRIETAFSQITATFPKRIHAVTPRGFELKVICHILAFAFRFLQEA